MEVGVLRDSEPNWVNTLSKLIRKRSAIALQTWLDSFTYLQQKNDLLFIYLLLLITKRNDGATLVWFVWPFRPRCFVSPSRAGVQFPLPIRDWLWEDAVPARSRPGSGTFLEATAINVAGARPTRIDRANAFYVTAESVCTAALPRNGRHEAFRGHGESIERLRNDESVDANAAPSDLIHSEECRFSGPLCFVCFSLKCRI